MIAFKSQWEAEEVRLIHPVLWEIVCWLSGEWMGLVGHEIMVITEVYRPRAETVAIYQAAGKTPPRISVHEVRPCRGVDVSLRVPDIGIPYGNWSSVAQFKADAIDDAVNEAWRYHQADRYKVGLIHDVAGAHLHLQCRPGDETRRR